VVVPISEELLDILVCPKCKQTLRFDAAKSALECTSCRLRYPVVDDIPVLIVSAAEPLD
jgi:uncharacterized protein